MSTNDIRQLEKELVKSILSTVPASFGRVERAEFTYGVVETHIVIALPFSADLKSVSPRMVGGSRIKN